MRFWRGFEAGPPEQKSDTLPTMPPRSSYQRNKTFFSSKGFWQPGNHLEKIHWCWPGFEPRPFDYTQKTASE